MKNSWENRGKLVGPIIHCSPDLTRDIEPFNNFARKENKREDF